MTDKSRTPRTDKVAERRTVIKDSGRTVTADYIVNADFARTLELEAADLRERLAEAEAVAEDRQRIYRDAYYRALSSLGSFDAALQTHIAKQVADALRALAYPKGESNG